MKLVDNPHVSYLLSVDDIMKAIDMVCPAIRAAMESGAIKRKDLHIVVMNPATRPFEVEREEDAILYEVSFGDPSTWEHDYKAIARAKAIASWRTGLPTHVVVQTMPYLLQANEDYSDTPYYGSVNLLGMPVGASGVEAWNDEMISYWIAAACRAVCIGKMQTKILTAGKDLLWQPGDGNLGDR